MKILVALTLILCTHLQAEMVQVTETSEKKVLEGSQDSKLDLRDIEVDLVKTFEKNKKKKSDKGLTGEELPREH